MSSKTYGHRFVTLFNKEIFQLKMDKKPCRKNSVLFLIPHIGLVVNVQLVVPGGGGGNYNDDNNNTR